MKLNRRRWVYIQDAPAYEIKCDRCGNPHVTWSEYRHLVWCWMCLKDTPGDGGIFDGPIPMQICKILGISFDRIHLKTGRILKMQETKSGRLIWKFERGEQ
jgi:hypothetical protein